MSDRNKRIRHVKVWDDMNLNQKRHALVNFLKARTTAFWKVCGKSMQQHYLHIDYTEENINICRDDIVSTYTHCLEHSDVLCKEAKLDYMRRNLLK